MFRKSILVVGIAAIAFTAYAANKEQKRLESCGTVLHEVLNTPENIPQNVMDKAECVVVFPGVLKAAFIFGGSYGRGAMACRTGEHFRGPWGAPAMMALEGGSAGLQIGGEATDLVLLIMNEGGANAILSSRVKLGGDASVAAGPVGRTASAETDVSMRAEILSYSRAHGVFAGISLEGSTIRPDDDATADVYGRKLTAREIVINGHTAIPASGRHLVAVLERHSPRMEAKSVGSR
jgi:SH3 domain-containing YSC84-like protein 1